MNVLSLFDGMSCGQIALDQLGIKVDNYFASEIDEQAISVTLKNYPKTVQVGDITQLDVSTLPIIDLLFGGSPCQSFSNAGNGKGFDGESGLFWEFVRVLKETNPKYFLLENVVMKKEWQDIITEALGVEPIKINSSLVSAGHRKRLYWTNIPNIQQPEDKGVFIEDIITPKMRELFKSTTGDSGTGAGLASISTIASIGGLVGSGAIMNPGVIGAITALGLKAFQYSPFMLKRFNEMIAKKNYRNALK